MTLQQLRYAVTIADMKYDEQGGERAFCIAAGIIEYNS